MNDAIKKLWCSAIEKELSNQLRESICIAKIWQPKIYVINDEMAKELEIIVS
ncbi:MAG: hypothetical protein LBK56_03670 [Gracilibacteraceae bacterium]|jgi:hypothetical protein|nr:hypothetical protein [Gracilibacteraceae bacterium]